MVASFIRRKASELLDIYREDGRFSEWKRDNETIDESQDDGSGRVYGGEDGLYKFDADYWKRAASGRSFKIPLFWMRF